MTAARHVATTRTSRASTHRCTTRCDDAATSRSTGELPAGLRGMFLRNGPNPMFEPKGRYHIFDGDGMLHGVTLDGEGGAQLPQPLGAHRRARRRATRRPRDLRRYGERRLPDARGDRRRPVDEERGQHERRSATPAASCACGKPALPTEVTACARDRRRRSTSAARSTGPFTAHPKLDPSHRRDVRLRLLADSAVPVAATSSTPTARSRVRSRSTCPAPVMMHDFAVTERHAVFLDAPAVFDLESFMQRRADAVVEARARHPLRRAPARRRRPRRRRGSRPTRATCSTS